MITKTKNLDVVMCKSHRRILCVLGNSAYCAESYAQGGMYSWFINLPVITGGPG